ncbi:MAG: Excalibur calcium-binding domain protein [Frankiales bacterium]|nr:Excalibur calcium-binding domain protein [Frankiales bacterium]
MRRHKVLTGIGVVVALGTVGNLTDSGDTGGDAASSTPVGIASFPSATSSTPGLPGVDRTVAPTTSTAPTTPTVNPTATAKPAASTAVVVASASPSPKPVATAAPKPSPKPVVTQAPAPVATKAPAPSAQEYANCTELNADYPHGVGRPGAKDKTSTGNPVTDFRVDQALYDANTKSDRDDDGIACEKH